MLFHGISDVFEIENSNLHSWNFVTRSDELSN